MYVWMPVGYYKEQGWQGLTPLRVCVDARQVLQRAGVAGLWALAWQRLVPLSPF